MTVDTCHHTWFQHKLFTFNRKAQIYRRPQTEINVKRRPEGQYSRHSSADRSNSVYRSSRNWGELRRRIGGHSMNFKRLPIRQTLILQPHVSEPKDAVSVSQPSTLLICCWTDTERGVLLGLPKSAICVQRFDDSLNSAIRITYRISLRSSSLREPRYPLLRVVF